MHGLCIRANLRYPARMSPNFTQPRSPRPVSRLVGRNVALLRASRSLTLADLQTRIVAAGQPSIPLSTISAMERGLGRVDVDQLVGLAAGFGIAPAVLITPLSVSGAGGAAVTSTGVDLPKYPREAED